MSGTAEATRRVGRIEPEVGGAGVGDATPELGLPPLPSPLHTSVRPLE
jgi:hypothetical protein